MRSIPYIIAALGIIIVGANLFLLCYPAKVKDDFLPVTLITGSCLITIVLLSIYSKRKLGKRQANYIHKIFSKN
jgi:hypothetical protein